MSEHPQKLNPPTCHEHSGCLSDICHLTESDRDQWSEIAKMRARIDNFNTRLNAILVTVLVGVILTLINLVAKVNP